MDKLSVTRPAPPSTGALVAGNHLCDQVANLLLIDPGECRRCFLGEPVKVVIAMTEWSISHEWA